jgi:hypothetical protein
MIQVAHGAYTFLLILLIFAGLFLLGTIVLTAKLQVRLRHLSGLTRPQFIEFFAIQGDGSRVAARVFDEYRGESFSREFRLSPDADLSAVFGQEPDDIFEVMTKVASDLDLGTPTQEDLQAIHAAGCFTAKQLVNRLVALRK